MKTQIIKIRDNQFLIGILESGYHPELWFRKMYSSAPSGHIAEFISKIGKMSIEQSEQYDFTIEGYKEAIKGSDAENWNMHQTYVFALSNNKNE